MDMEPASDRIFQGKLDLNHIYYVQQYYITNSQFVTPNAEPTKFWRLIFDSLFSSPPTFQQLFAIKQSQCQIFVTYYQLLIPTRISMHEEKSEEEVKRLQEIRLRVREEGLNPMLKKQRSQTDDQFILTALKNHFVFYNLSEAELNNVRDYMWWTQFPTATPIFRQGQQGSCFFIIASGVVEVIVDGKNIKTLKAGEGFGQLALLYEIDRPSTVQTKEEVGMWVIDRSSFREAVQEIVIQQFEENQKYLEGVAFYQFLNNRQKQKVASSFVVLKYYKGQNIIEEGDPGSAFYIIKSGTASLIQGNIEERKIFKGESFGINSLYYNTMRKMTVRAEEEVICQVLGRETLSKIIGPQIYRESMFRNFVKYTLQKNKQLFSLIKNDEETFFENMKTKYYKTNSVVFKKGSIVHKLIIIIEGRIKKFRSANFLAQAGQAWGENYLKIGNDVRLDDDIVVETESVLIQLSLDSIRNAKSHAVDHEKSEIKKQQVQKIAPQHFTYISEMADSPMCSYHFLACGNKKLIGKLFKLNQIEKENALQILKQQIEVVQKVEHPFVPFFFQIIEHKSSHTMVITEYVQGQSLYDVIREIGLLSTMDCQFYAACMISLLQYFLREEIVVRDLKPDNFIVDQKGYLNLVSLGSAKCINQSHRTSTVIGTPHYMAPEVVLGKQYNEMIDLWAVGVMLYEFMVGELPFGAMTENPYEIYEQIIQGDPSFPRNFKDRRAKKIIETLLSLNPESRHTGSYSSLKNNSWFENINWDKLVQKTIDSPFKPTHTTKFPKLEGSSLQVFLKSL